MHTQQIQVKILFLQSGYVVMKQSKLRRLELLNGVFTTYLVVYDVTLHIPVPRAPHQLLLLIL